MGRRRVGRRAPAGGGLEDLRAWAEIDNPFLRVVEPAEWASWRDVYGPCAEAIGELELHPVAEEAGTPVPPARAEPLALVGHRVLRCGECLRVETPRTALADLAAAVGEQLAAGRVVRCPECGHAALQAADRLPPRRDDEYNGRGYEPGARAARRRVVPVTGFFEDAPAELAAVPDWRAELADDLARARTALRKRGHLPATADDVDLAALARRTMAADPAPRHSAVALEAALEELGVSRSWTGVVGRWTGVVGATPPDPRARAAAGVDAPPGDYVPAPHEAWGAWVPTWPAYPALEAVFLSAGKVVRGVADVVPLAQAVVEAEEFARQGSAEPDRDWDGVYVPLAAALHPCFGARQLDLWSTPAGNFAPAAADAEPAEQLGRAATAVLHVVRFHRRLCRGVPLAHTEWESLGRCLGLVRLSWRSHLHRLLRPTLRTLAALGRFRRFGDVVCDGRTGCRWLVVERGGRSVEVALGSGAAPVTGHTWLNRLDAALRAGRRPQEAGEPRSAFADRAFAVLEALDRAPAAWVAEHRCTSLEDGVPFSGAWLTLFDAPYGAGKTQFGMRFFTQLLAPWIGLRGEAVALAEEAWARLDAAAQALSPVPAEVAAAGAGAKGPALLEWLTALARAQQPPPEAARAAVLKLAELGAVRGGREGDGPRLGEGRPDRFALCRERPEQMLRAWAATGAINPTRAAADPGRPLVDICKWRAHLCKGGTAAGLGRPPRVLVVVNSRLLVDVWKALIPVLADYRTLKEECRAARARGLSAAAAYEAYVASVSFVVCVVDSCRHFVPPEWTPGSPPVWDLVIVDEYASCLRRLDGRSKDVAGGTYARMLGWVRCLRAARACFCLDGDTELREVLVALCVAGADLRSLRLQPRPPRAVALVRVTTLPFLDREMVVGDSHGELVRRVAELTAAGQPVVVPCATRKLAERVWRLLATASGDAAAPWGAFLHHGGSRRELIEELAGDPDEVLSTAQAWILSPVASEGLSLTRTALRGGTHVAHARGGATVRSSASQAPARARQCPCGFCRFSCPGAAQLPPGASAHGSRPQLELACERAAALDLPPGAEAADLLLLITALNDYEEVRSETCPLAEAMGYHARHGYTVTLATSGPRARVMAPWSAGDEDAEVEASAAEARMLWNVTPGAADIARAADVSRAEYERLAAGPLAFAGECRAARTKMRLDFGVPYGTDLPEAFVRAWAPAAKAAAFRAMSLCFGPGVASGRAATVEEAQQRVAGLEDAEQRVKLGLAVGALGLLGLVNLTDALPSIKAVEGERGPWAAWLLGPAREATGGKPPAERWAELRPPTHRHYLRQRTRVAERLTGRTVLAFARDALRPLGLRIPSSTGLRGGSGLGSLTGLDCYRDFHVGEGVPPAHSAALRRFDEHARTLEPVELGEGELAEGDEAGGDVPRRGLHAYAAQRAAAAGAEARAHQRARRGRRGLGKGRTLRRRVGRGRGRAPVRGSRRAVRRQHGERRSPGCGGRGGRPPGTRARSGAGGRGPRLGRVGE